MAIRTDADTVKEILLNDYGPKEDGTLPDLTPRIRAASLLVDQIVALGAAGHCVTALIPSTDLLTEIETYLAAHLYCVSDRIYTSRSTQGASGSFAGQVTNKLESSFYGQTAMILDTSGILTALNKRAVLRAVWLGKTLSEQTNYDDRQ